MNINIEYDEINCLDTYTFIEKDEVVGIANIDPHNEGIFIFNINSYKKGTGTKMIDYFKSLNYVKRIEGDIEPDSLGFGLLAKAKCRNK